MKKIIKPSEHEEAVYYSDFTGKILNEFPPIEIAIDCNYGSRYDDSKLKLHLDDKDFEELLSFLKRKTLPEFEHVYDQFK